MASEFGVDGWGYMAARERVDFVTRESDIVQGTDSEMPSRAASSGDGYSEDWDEILAGCRAGERAAQAHLYDRSVNRIYRLMARMVGPQDAPDVTQQVYMQVFRKVHQFRGQARFETWLYRVAVNEAYQYLRKRQRRPSERLGFEPVDDRISNERAAQQRDLLEQALSRIEPELRAIFLLREKEELSYQEIAQTLEIPEGTVGSRLNRARRELRKVLCDLGWEGAR